MSEKPIRIQRKRAKGWKMPENTVCVTRPSKFGNPFRWQDLLHINSVLTNAQARHESIRCFKLWLQGDDSDWMGTVSEKARQKMLESIPELKGKNLACFCPEGAECHADVLLELANAPRAHIMQKENEDEGH